MTSVEYTYDWYRSFLRRYRDAGFDFLGFDDDPTESAMYLRHDVDWSPDLALRKAKIEADIGVQATYFFLVTSPFYNALSASNRAAIGKIEDLGHDVGLHFAPNEYFDTEPEPDRLMTALERDSAVLDGITEDLSPAVAFHNPPDWSINAEFPGFTSTYEPRFVEEITYIADSLGRWREQPPATDTLPPTVHILTHPTLWGETDQPPKERIRAVQRAYVDRTDSEMERASRLDW